MDVDVADVKRGVLYIAFGAQYRDWALASAESVKAHNPGLAVCLMSDREEKSDAVDIFRRIIPAGKRAKVDYVSKTPFEQTLYLDADTIISGDLTPVFEALGRFDLAITQDFLHSQGWKADAMPEYAAIPYSFPECNGGVMAYNLNAKVKAFLAEWQRVYHEYKVKTKRQDQPSLRVALWNSDLRFHVLPAEYNTRPIANAARLDALLRSDPAERRLLQPRISHWRGIKAGDVPMIATDLPQECGEKDMKPIVISFWCDSDESGSYYRESAENLRASCERVGVDYVIEEISLPAVGSEKQNWLARCAFKLDFIEAKLQELKRPVLWIDADSVIDEWQDLPSADIVVVDYDSKYKCDKDVQCGMIAFDYNQRVMGFFDSWRQEIERFGNDHKGFDKAIKAAQDLKIERLPHGFWWRGEPYCGRHMARTFKRVRPMERESKTNATVVTVCFGKAFEVMLQAHKNSVRSTMPLAKHDVVELVGGCAPGFKPENHYKFKAWVEAVERYQGENIVLMDADTLVLKDIRSAFDRCAADIILTEKPGEKPRVNAGVVFVRCNPQTLGFFRHWLELDAALFADPALRREAEALQFGQNQASLALMMRDNPEYEDIIGYLHCQEWNCENVMWKYFDANTRVLHIKNGLRHTVLNKKYDKRLYREPTAAQLVTAWNMYAPAGETFYPDAIVTDAAGRTRGINKEDKKSGEGVDYYIDRRGKKRRMPKKRIRGA